ncbi:AAA family ATPase [Deinococcus sp.]|uniref:AAA family ATPase n=1 Tax=Deinococcus sp. TaxID=47478 RepID=UPI003C7ACE47
MLDVSLTPLAAPIVYLLGWPGVGKLTVANELARRTGWRVLDSHRIYFPVFYAVGADGQTPLPPGTRELAGQVRAAVLEAVQRLAPPELGFVFTNALADLPQDREMFAELEAVASARRAPFLPVLLTADEAVLRRRVTSEGRAERLKPRTDAVLDRYFAAYTQLVPDHPNLLRLDTTNLLPAQTADAVLAWLNSGRPDQ